MAYVLSGVLRSIPQCNIHFLDLHTSMLGLSQKSLGAIHSATSILGVNMAHVLSGVLRSIPQCNIHFLELHTSILGLSQKSLGAIPSATSILGMNMAYVPSGVLRSIPQCNIQFLELHTSILCLSQKSLGAIHSATFNDRNQTCMFRFQGGEGEGRVQQLANMRLCTMIGPQGPSAHILSGRPRQI